MLCPFQTPPKRFLRKATKSLPASASRFALRARIEPSTPTGPALRTPTLKRQSVNIDRVTQHKPYCGGASFVTAVCTAAQPPHATCRQERRHASTCVAGSFLRGTWHRSAKSAFSKWDHAEVLTANCTAKQETSCAKRHKHARVTSQLASGRSSAAWALHKPMSLTQPSGQSAPKSWYQRSELRLSIFTS